MAEDILSQAQKQEIRLHLAALDAPIETDAEERFLASTVMFLLGATFDDLSNRPGISVHGVPWTLPSEVSVLVSVYVHHHALEHAEGGYLVFRSAEQLQVLMIMGYLRENFPDHINEVHVGELQRAITILRDRPAGF